MKKLIILTILTIALLLPTTSQAFDSAYSGAQVDAEIARGIGRNTTVANPGSDAELVTEQAVREALDALSLGTAATRDAEDAMTNGSNLPDGAAIKTYGDANWGGAGTLVFKTHDAPQGTDPVADLVEDTLQWLEGEGIDITGSSAADSITIKGEDASAANKGIASFNSTRFTVVAGAVDIATVAGITGANEDDVTLTDIQGACTNDFHNIGGVDDERTQEEIDDYVNALIKDADSVHTRITITYDDPNNAFDFVVDDMNDDVPDAGDFGAAEDLNANGGLNAGCVAGNEIASTAVVAGSYTSTNLTVDDDGRITAAANGSAGGGGGAFVNAADYSGTDRAKIQAAINEAQSNGGIVYIPDGTWTVDDHDADGNCLEITSEITVMGDGPRNTIIRTASNTANVFYVNSAPAITIKDMSIEHDNVGTPTGGSGIYLTALSGNNYGSRLDNLRITHLYDGINTDRAHAWYITNSMFNGQHRYDLLIRNNAVYDAGDSMISNCRFIGDLVAGLGTAAIRQESSGGLKITNSKLQHRPLGFDLYLGAGIATSILDISNCSLEDQTTHSIKLTQASTGYIHTIIINGNQIRKGIEINAATDDRLSRIVISDNVIRADGDDGIEINGGQDIIIDGNHFFRSSVGYAVNNVGGVSVSVGDNWYSGFTAAQLFNGTIDNIRYPKGPYIRDIAPSFWLDETDGGGKGANLVLDGGSFQIQKRATDFGAYETTPFQVALATGNLTVTGTASASCGALTCDYVFEEDYNLMLLDDLQEFVQGKKKLPGMTIGKAGSYTTATLREELVEKVEEQALYILQLHERLKTLEARLN